MQSIKEAANESSVFVNEPSSHTLIKQLNLNPSKLHNCFVVRFRNNAYSIFQTMSLFR